jgi:predicted nucleic acid-binding protein
MWVVDTCVVIDVLENDREFGLASARMLQNLLSQGLAISPVTMVELGAAFGGDLPAQKEFLDHAGIVHDEPWTGADTDCAHAAWDAYMKAKRAGAAARRPIADILIGAFAANRRGLVTRNGPDFQRWFPKLTVRQP